MSNTTFTGDWQKIVPDMFVVQGLQKTVLDWLMDRQRRIIAKYGGDENHPSCRAFLILDDVIADQKAIRWSADLNSLFVEGRHLGITTLLATQYTKGVGPMVRNNLDFMFLQPIYNGDERDVLRKLEASSMNTKEWAQFMDDVIQRKLLPGYTPSDPKKEVRIMVCAEFEDTAEATQKFFHWTPVHHSQLPKFRLCAPAYWEASRMQKDRQQIEVTVEGAFEDVVDTLESAAW